MSVDLETNLTIFPVHQSVAPYVQIYSKDMSPEKVAYFVPWDICHSWGYALPSEIPSPVSATPSPIGDIPMRPLTELLSCSRWQENGEW